MKHRLLTFSLLAAIAAQAQMADLAFARQFAGVNPGNGDDVANSVAYAPDGSIYVVGSFYGVFDLDPGSTTATVTSAGDRDIYAVKPTSKVMQAGATYQWMDCTNGSVPTAGEIRRTCLKQ